jgi:hypothetical protein
MMKKALLCLFSVSLIASAATAQLSNSNWKGVIKTDNNINVTFDFGKDTLTVKNIDDNSTIETMIYALKDSTFTIKKISGISDCDHSTIGQYSFQMKDNTLTFILVTDPCDDRSPVLNNLQLKKAI